MSLNRGKPNAMDLRWRKRQAKKQDEALRRGKHKQWLETKVALHMEEELARLLQDMREKDESRQRVLGIDFGTGPDAMAMVIGRKLGNGLGIDAIAFYVDDCPDIDTLLKELGDIYDAEAGRR